MFSILKKLGPSKVINFILLSSNNVINNSFATFILLIFVFKNDLNDATNLAIISAFTILLTKVFSINLRNIYIAKFDTKNLDNFILLRLTISSLIIISCFLFAYFYLSIINKKIYLLILIFIFQWILELSLVKFELNKKTRITNFLFFINIFFLISILISVFYFNYLLFMEILIVNLVIILFFILKSIDLSNLEINKIFFKNLRLMFTKTINSNSFLSSFSLNIANLLWRILVSYYVGKNTASIIFFFYALGSFPGTIFNVSFGPSMVRNKMKKINLILFFLSYIILISPIIFLMYFKIDNYMILNSDLTYSFFLNISFFSLVGSLIMLYAMFFRQQKINNMPTFYNKVFLKDFYVSIGIIVIVPILYYIGGVYYLSLSYFFSAIISMIFYSLLKK